MRNLLMTVSYDGTNYFGFQTQPGGNTVQDHIEEAIRQLTGEQVKIHGSGRTDAGVHARQQPFHFHTASKIPVERWGLALNGRLPSDIRVLTAQEVPLTFHSRRSAKRKTYRYTINANRITDVFQRNYQLHHPGKLNVIAMQEVCRICSVRMITPRSPRVTPRRQAMFVPFMMPGSLWIHQRTFLAQRARGSSIFMSRAAVSCSTWSELSSVRYLR
ncbi:hypothetical protein HMSSN139_57040 [Paenibacillus sp. HMSSN-139]|nr:hypothetical protein HMSSN139_57040 [Paenibacillus sp. HMSSN-139]